MIILKIKYIIDDRPIQDAVDELRECLPNSSAWVGAGTMPGLARDDDHYIYITLNQDSLTDDQRDYLHMSYFAQRHIDEYSIEPGCTEIKPTLEPWQVETVNDILVNDINKVPSNGNHTRYYTEPLAERQWDNEHHLIDIEGKEPMYGKLTITQCSTSDPVQVVKLSYNEVDELLTALLQWRMDAARASHEAATKVNDDSLSDLDDRPF